MYNLILCKVSQIENSLSKDNSHTSLVHSTPHGSQNSKFPLIGLKGFASEWPPTSNPTLPVKEYSILTVTDTGKHVDTL